MLSTIVFAAIFVGMLIATGVLFGMFLRLGLRWAKVPDVTTRRIVYATAIVITLQIAISALFHICLLYTSPSPRDQRGYRMPSSA